MNAMRVLTAMEEDTRIVVTTYRPDFDGDIMDLCQLFVKESLHEYGLNVTQERADQMTCICKNEAFFIVDNGRAVGVIAGLIVDCLTNGKPALQEVIWFVNPEYRKHGHKLLKAFEDRAKELRVSSIVMGLMVNSMQERLDKLYKKMGYRPFEVQYIKELEYGA